jgi:acetoin:2,6-dichlorophenolindophenol oxidoreductase subunit alpha
VNAQTSPALIRELLRQMTLIRRFEETALNLRLEGRIYGTMHPYIGEESIAVGVCSALRADDRVVSNHRGHGHCIAKGADVGRMFAELFGRRDGYCRGRGGSMHIADFSIGMLGANGIVAAGMPIATGSALAAQMAGRDVVTVCFFGDGATGEGAFHESLNIAALWKLPVLWVCENNGYAAETPATKAVPAGDVAAYAAGYAMPGESVDGNDVFAVREVALRLVERARRGDGPALLECKTFRVGVHAQRGAPIPDKREASEVARWRALDPIDQFVQRASAEGLISEETVVRVRAEVEGMLTAAVEFAEASPFPDPADALDGVFAT